MKKLVALMMVLAISGVASAALTFNANGSAMEISVQPSDIVQITIVASPLQLANCSLFITTTGPGVASLVAPFNNVNPLNDPPIADYTILEDENGQTYNFANTFGADFLFFADLGKPAVGALMPEGVILGGIQFHCTGLGDVVLNMWDPDTQVVYGTLVVHQIPEPMTLGLLGLGGLFLRRRLA